MKIVMTQDEVEQLLRVPLAKDPTIKVKDILWQYGSERFVEIVLESNR